MKTATRTPSIITPKFGKLQEPFKHDEDNVEDYLKKASLSPWVPLPDSAARKVFDVAEATADDVHVDLGSGDGRVCFHAIDVGVKKSTGIDVDEAIVTVAQDRLAKRHPQPDLTFYVADLMDENHNVWEQVQEATIITMYFTTEALEKIRPLLEEKLIGRQCRILTCGYEMPGWESRISEVVLGTQIHLYDWGNTMGEDSLPLFEEDIIKEKPTQLTRQHAALANANDGRNMGTSSKVVDHSGQYPIRGFNPDIFNEEEDDDEDWDAVDAEEEEEDSDDGEGETDPDVEEFRAKFRAKQGKKRPNCGGSKRAEG